MNYGQVSAANTSLKQTAPTITSAIEEFDPLIKRAQEYASRLEGLCGRIAGPSPTGNGESSADQIPVSMIVSINVRRNQLVDQLSRIENAINTIEHAL